MLNIKKQKIILGLIMVIVIGGSCIGYKHYKNIKKQKNINILVNNADKYIEKEDYDKAIQLYKQALSYKTDYNILNKIRVATQCEKNKKIYNRAVKEFNNKNYDKALELLSKVNKEDTKYFKLAQNKIKMCKEIYIKDNILKFNNALKNNLFDDANKYISNISDIDRNNSQIQELKNKINKTKAKFRSKQNTLINRKLIFTDSYTLKNIPKLRDGLDMSEFNITLEPCKDNNSKARIGVFSSSRGGAIYTSAGYATYKENGIWSVEMIDGVRYRFLKGILKLSSDYKTGIYNQTYIYMPDYINDELYNVESIDLDSKDPKVQHYLSEFRRQISSSNMCKETEVSLIRCDNYKEKVWGEK